MIDFNRNFPKITPDIYLYKIENDIIKKNITNEWEFSEYLKNQSFNFMIENPKEFLISIKKNYI